METTALSFTLSVPPDPRYGAMLRDVIACAARQSGCAEAQAEAFGRRVEEAAVETKAVKGQKVSVSVRQLKGAMEVRVGIGGAAQTLTVSV